MAQLSISVPDSLKTWIEKHAEKGGDYSTPSEFVRSVLREKKAQEENLLGELENLLVEGFESGNPVEDTAKYRKELRLSLKKRLAKLTAKPSQ